MPIFVTPTKLRLTEAGVVNLDFLDTGDGVSRLTEGGVVGEGVGLGGGGETITLDSGSYFLAGTIIGLIADSNLVTNSGSYELTGADLIFIDPPASSVITIDSGEVLLTGSQIKLTASFNAITQSGNYAVTGTNINTSIAAIMTIDNGSYIIDGASVTLRDSGNIWADKTPTNTLWGDKAQTSTSWVDKTSVTTIWTDK